MQIVIVGGCHWCTASNIGCDDGVVNVYNNMYSSVSSATLKLIASLVFSPAKQLVVRMMDVGRQSNGSDCGVLAIAFAYDICSGNHLCWVKFDDRSIRQHLAKNSVTYPASRYACERRSATVRHTQSIDLHCSCRLPEVMGTGDKMAECEVCKTWFHQHCMDIPDKVSSLSLHDMFSLIIVLLSCTLYLFSLCIFISFSVFVFSDFLSTSSLLLLVCACSLNLSLKYYVYSACV